MTNPVDGGASQVALANPFQQRASDVKPFKTPAVETAGGASSKTQNEDGGRTQKFTDAPSGQTGSTASADKGRTVNLVV